MDLQTHTNSALNNPVTLTFDRKVNACRATAMLSVSTKFGVDSSNRFTFN